MTEGIAAMVSGPDRSRGLLRVPERPRNGTRRRRPIPRRFPEPGKRYGAASKRRPSPSRQRASDSVASRRAGGWAAAGRRAAPPGTTDRDQRERAPGRQASARYRTDATAAAPLGTADLEAALMSDSMPVDPFHESRDPAHALVQEGGVLFDALAATKPGGGGGGRRSWTVAEVRCLELGIGS